MFTHFFRLCIATGHDEQRNVNPLHFLYISLLMDHLYERMFNLFTLRHMVRTHIVNVS